jgi:hypothetical protein
MDDLLEILWLPVDVYAQWWAGMRHLMREAPVFTALYIVVAVILAIRAIRWLRRGPLTFKRIFYCCLAVALLVMPGAVANGGMSILPLAVVVAVSLIWLLYNFTLFAIAALVALIVAWIVYKAAAGKAPAAERSVDLTRP